MAGEASLKPLISHVIDEPHKYRADEKILDFSQIGDTGYISVVRKIANLTEIQDLGGAPIPSHPAFEHRIT